MLELDQETISLQQAINTSQTLIGNQPVSDNKPLCSNQLPCDNQLACGKQTNAGNRGIKLSPKLSHAQIALLYFYEGWPITRATCSAIAEKFGYKPGMKLYNIFVEKIKQPNRIYGKNAIKDIDSILSLLSDSATDLALKDLAESRRVRACG